MGEERINVCYGISDKSGNYAKIMGTSICSLLENTDAPVTVHILHDETLSAENKAKIGELAKGHGQRAFFYDVSIKWKELWKEIGKNISEYMTDFRFTMGSFFRLVIGEILENESRAIYLDADTIVNIDIRELWESKIPDSGLAAVKDAVISKHGLLRVIRKGLVAQEEYFNSGVLLIDLEKFRTLDKCAKKCMEFIAEYKPEGPDQDFLNYYFPHSSVLPEDYNCFVWRGRQKGGPQKGYIYHYVGNCVGLNMEDNFNRLYFEYFLKTPWLNVDFIGNLAKKIEEVNYGFINFANMVAGKRRIAIGLASGREVVSERFNLQAEDLYIPFEDIENFSMDFKKSKDVFMIFLTENDYPAIKDRFVSLGLEENIHFFDMLSMLGISKKNRIDYKLFISC